MTFVLIGISAHPIWIGLIFAYFIGYKWRITPITSYADFFNPPPGQPGGPVQWAYHLILPWMTFMILFAALYVRMIRANVIETLNEDYVRTARAKGAPEHLVHALAHPAERDAAGRDDARHGHRARARRRDLHRDDLQPPGPRRTAVQALNNYDIPTVHGGHRLRHDRRSSSSTSIVDLLYAGIDPRIRLA